MNDDEARRYEIEARAIARRIRASSAAAQLRTAAVVLDHGERFGHIARDIVEHALTCMGGEGS